MTPAEFQRIGEQMYGRKHWRQKYAINLALHTSTVWRISTRDGKIPGVVEVAVRGLFAEYSHLKRMERYAREKQARERKRAGEPPNKTKRSKRIVVRYTKKDIENEIPQTDE